MVRLSRLRPRTPQHCTAVTEAFLFVGVSSGSTVMAHYHGTTRRSSDSMPEDCAPLSLTLLVVVLHSAGSAVQG
jgi:hypothetical protein